MNEQQKILIRFFDDREVRAIWDEQNAKWWFSVLDIVALLNNQNDYTKSRNYWKYLKAKLKKENNQLVSATTQLKLLAPDGKRRLTDMLDYEGIISLGKDRVWLDLILKKRLQRCVDWSKIGKNDYMNAMIKSAVNCVTLKRLLKNALTDQINSREMYMKGIDYSYYYEENN